MGSRWAALGDFGGHFWHRRLSLGHFEITWGICIHFGKFLAAISTYEGDFKSFWVDFGIALGSLWGHFGVNLGSFLAYESDFGSLWVHFEIIV